jgi:hypothetical protein
MCCQNLDPFGIVLQTQDSTLRSSSGNFCCLIQVIALTKVYKHTFSVCVCACVCAYTE